MIRTLAIALALLLALPAASQPVRVGPLDVRNGLAEIAAGGAGAQAAARGNLGLGSIATQNAGAVAITGGTVSGASVLATGAGTARTLAAIAADRVNVRGLGAAGDGVTVDLGPLTTGTGPWYLPAGTYYTGTSIYAIPAGRWYSAGSGGRLVDIEGGVVRQGPPNLSVITAAPATNPGYSDNGLAKAFDGDFSHLQHAGATVIRGASTLGQPASGYQLNPLAGAAYWWLDNSSGWNQATGGNNGRTGVANQYLRFSQSGQGDVFGAYVSGTVSGVKAGATSFLANSAGTTLGGQIFAGGPGVYMQGVGDINLNDQGFDVSGVGLVINSLRHNGTGALGATWMAIRPQSQGSVAIDAFYSASGPARIGLDLTGAILQDLAGTPVKSAITLAAGQAIYGNAVNSDVTHYARYTNPGTEYLSYETASGWNLVVGGVPILQAAAGGVSVTQLRITSPSVPAASSTACAKGQVAYDASYAYFCVATNTWKRAALASW